MPEPITLALGLHAAWGLIPDDAKSGVLGNRADWALTTAMKKLGTVLSKGSPAQNDGILRATHVAYVSAMRHMANTCNNIALSQEERKSADALRALVQSKSFSDFRETGEHFPLQATNEAIERGFNGTGPAEPDILYNRIIVADLVAWGIVLPPLFTQLFEGGVPPHEPWHATFRKTFSDTLLADRKALTIFTVERLNEVRAAGITISEVVTNIQATLREGFTESARADAITHQLLRETLAKLDRQSEAEIKDASLEPALLKIARKIAEDVDRPEHALAELDRAVNDLLSLRADANRGTNLDEITDEALRRVAERASAGEFDAAARDGEAAFAAWQSRETERRERERQAGVRLIEQNITTHRLRRDVEAVANWIERRLALEAGDSSTTLAAYAAEFYGHLNSGRDKGVNLDLEIAAALARRLRVYAGSDLQRGEALNLLGIVLDTLGERRADVATLIQAVSAYHAALQFQKREVAPRHWAGAQNNLGNALRALGSLQGDIKLLTKAARAYQSALEVRTKADLPLDWGMTHNNLGNALLTLGEWQDDASILERAVESFHTALTVYTRDDQPSDWAMIQNNLGVALSRLGTLKKDTTALTTAIEAHRAALSVYTRDDSPVDWAMTQTNLGTALHELGAQQENCATLNSAVDAHLKALTVYSRDDQSLNWAGTQNNLGVSLSAIGKIQDDTASISSAIKAFRAALEVQTPERLPIARAGTCTSLADALLVRARKVGDCNCAREAVNLLIEAITFFESQPPKMLHNQAVQLLKYAQSLVMTLCTPSNVGFRMLHTGR